MAVEENLAFVFHPEEEIEPFKIKDMIFMPEAACLACERIIDEQTWKDLLEKIDDCQLDQQVKRVLEASARERLVVFATSGLAHCMVEQKSLERTVYGCIEKAFRRLLNHSMAEKFDAAFVMMRIYLQGRKMMVVQGKNREWLAKMLQIAFECIGPFCFKDVLPQVQTLCDALRSNQTLPVLLSIGDFSWKQHWSQLLSRGNVYQWFLETFQERAPNVCRELSNLTPRVLKHLPAEFYNEILTQEKDELFRFDLFANMVSLTNSAFNLAPLSDTYVFEEI